MPYGDMTPEEFRRHGHRLVDWIATYFETVEQRPVLSRAEPGELVRALSAEAPQEGEPFDRIIDDLDRLILPATTHWNHPGFFAYFAITGSAPGVLMEFVSAALNQQAMLWRTSPAATELESVTLRWLARLMHLPDDIEGVIYDTASISTLHALAAARERAVPDVRTKGLAARPAVNGVSVYCSEHAHSSVDKAVIALGLGHESLRHIPADGKLSMQVSALEDAIRRDRTAGRLPVAVVATVGTTSSTSVDDVSRIAEVCRGEDIWLHVDAAYAGVMAMVPGFEWMRAGFDQADSLVVNPHKWLFTPFDLSVLFTRRMDVLRQAFSLVPEYLKTSETAPVKNLMDTGIQLGRRFRALKLWAVLRYFGADGIRARLAHHCELARRLADWVDADPDFTRVAAVPFSVVCLRATPKAVTEAGGDLDALNERILARVNRSGDVFLSHTKLSGAYVIRLAIGHLATEERHVRRAWDLLREACRLELAVDH